jgi:hypothetical protein
METNEKEKITIFKCNNCGLSNTELKEPTG